jgi:tetratricopeptide (TPR) repeat protein
MRLCPFKPLVGWKGRTRLGRSRLGSCPSSLIVRSGLRYALAAACWVTSALCVYAVQQIKARGDAAFRSGEFLPAIEQFNVVLEQQPRFIAALSNRAAALLALDQPARCIDDCNSVLSLLGFDETSSGARAEVEIDCVPPRGSQRHKSFVATTLVRRGTAASRLGHYAEAVEDYTAALKLEPENAQLAEDLKRVRARTAVSPSDLCKAAT